MITLVVWLYVAIPAALRHRYGLRAGDRVLLTAWPGEDALAAYPLAVISQAIHAHGLVPTRRRLSMTAVAGLPLGDREARPEVLAAPGGAGADGPIPRQHAGRLRCGPAAPTFAEYVPVVSAAVTAGTRPPTGLTGTGFVELWGDRRLDGATPSETARQLMAYVRSYVVARRNAFGGRSAAEHLVAVLRRLYRHEMTAA